MKKLFFILQCVFAFCVVNAQTWSALGSGLGSTSPDWVEGMAIYNGNLYAGGNFNTAGSITVNNIARWNGITWDSVGNGFINVPLYSLYVYKNELYVGGDSPWGQGIVRWNDTVWKSVGGGVSGFPATVSALSEYNNELYAGGEFNSAGGVPANLIARWNGSLWDSVDAGIYGANVHAMAVYSNELYVAGGFDSAGHIAAKNIAKWNGTNWSAVGNGTSAWNDKILDLTVYNNELYAVGSFSIAAGIPARGIVKWNGSSWSSLNNVNNTGMYFFALTVYNNELYAGGYFDTLFVSSAPKSINSIARWNASSWDSVGSGINYNNVSGSVWGLLNDTINNTLYVGGTFNNAGGLSAINIARWSTPSGISENTKTNNINIYPNPMNSHVSFLFSTQKKSNNVQLAFYDLYGKEVSSNIKVNLISQTQQKTEVNVINVSLKNGVYIYKVYSDNELIGTGKIIVIN
ncbi:MAG: T9SS type A sorting domain-containing protein [Bacteroidetes bacterium]|nr:T9SS type A sorting domain-containing protein [Bacteroidota bacterium]